MAKISRFDQNFKGISISPPDKRLKQMIIENENEILIIPKNIPIPNRLTTVEFLESNLFVI